MPAKPLPAEDLQSILHRTAPLWQQARGARIFLTGGTGFFGSWLIESFCHINRSLGLQAQLVILSRNPAAFAVKCPHLAHESSIAFHEGDVRNFTFPPGSFRYVMHAATDTRATVVANAAYETFSTIVQGTDRVLQFAVHTGAEKLLLTSSGAIYGRQPSDLERVPETYQGAPNPLDPASVYAEGKRAAELLCSIYNSPGKLECKIARCWAFCGPHLPLDQHFAIGNFIRDALRGGPIKINGDGTARRSYLYAADLTAWLWTILFKAPALEPFNVGSSHDLSILELAQQVVSALEVPVEIQVAQTPQLGVGPSRYVPCVERAGRDLGLHQTVGLTEMIQRTAAWYAD